MKIIDWFLKSSCKQLLAIRYYQNKEFVKLAQYLDNHMNEVCIVCFVESASSSTEKNNCAFLLTKCHHKNSEEIFALLSAYKIRIFPLSLKDIEKKDLLPIDLRICNSQFILASSYIPDDILYSCTHDDMQLIKTSELASYQKNRELAVDKLEEHFNNIINDLLSPSDRVQYQQEIQSNKLLKIETIKDELNDIALPIEFPIMNTMKSRLAIPNISVVTKKISSQFENHIKHLILFTQAEQSPHRLDDHSYARQEVCYYKPKPASSRWNLKNIFSIYKEKSEDSKNVKRSSFLPAEPNASRIQDSQDSSSSSKINSAIFAPLEAKRGKDMLIQVYLYLENEYKDVAAKARVIDKNAETRNYSPLNTNLHMGDIVDIHLSYSDKSIEIDEPEQQLIWQGHHTSVEFIVNTPSNYYRSTMSGTITISTKGMPLGKMKFVTMLVDNPTKLFAKISTTEYKKIFMSYSHKDHTRVESMAEGFRLLGNVDYFFDRHALKAGEAWESVIHDFINSADLFVLFWSQNAAESEWVTKEYTWALERWQKEGDDAIYIHPMHIAPMADAPAALSKIHFLTLE